MFEKHRSPFYYGFVIAALGFLIQAVGGRLAWCARPNPTGGYGRFLYFDVDPSFLRDGDARLQIRVGYFDDNSTTFCLEYDSCDPARTGLDQQFLLSR